MKIQTLFFGLSMAMGVVLSAPVFASDPVPAAPTAPAQPDAAPTVDEAALDTNNAQLLQARADRAALTKDALTVNPSMIACNQLNTTQAETCTRIQRQIAALDVRIPQLLEDRRALLREIREGACPDCAQYAQAMLSELTQRGEDARLRAHHDESDRNFDRHLKDLFEAQFGPSLATNPPVAESSGTAQSH